MTGLDMLMNLTLAFGNTPRAKLGRYAERDLMKIFEELNCDHIDELI
jgi:hypothetical protein